MEEQITRLLTDESVIAFTDGTIVKGSEEVAKLICRACREYNHGYILGFTKSITKGIVIGAIIAGVSIGIVELVKIKKLKKMEELGA